MLICKSLFRFQTGFLKTNEFSIDSNIDYVCSFKIRFFFVPFSLHVKFNINYYMTGRIVADSRMKIRISDGTDLMYKSYLLNIYVYIYLSILYIVYMIIV